MIYLVVIMIVSADIPLQEVLSPITDSGSLAVIVIIQIVFIYCLFDWMLKKYFDS